MEHRSNVGSAEMLRSYVERIERLDVERKSISDGRKAVLAEAEANGFVKSGINNVIKRRRMKPSEWNEEMSLLDTYSHALGMESDLPLFKQVSMMKVDITSKANVITALKKMVPNDGSIVVEVGGKSVRMTRSRDGEVTVADVLPPRQSDLSSSDAYHRFANQIKPVPDVSESEAEEAGRVAYRDDEAIVSNPFPFGDKRRPLWDKGWRDASGSDGMDD